MVTYEPLSPFIFIHIPKTAGQSVKRIVSNWFKSDFYPHYFDERNGGLPPKRELASLTGKANGSCVYGHFNRLRQFGVEDYYPEVKQFVTILRDPLEMAISSYFYIRRSSIDWQDKSRAPKGDLEDYLLNTPLNMLNHFPRIVTKDNYKEIIETFFIFIGTTENLLPSMQQIAALLAKPMPTQLDHVNSTIRKEYNLTDELVECFKQRNQLEYLVYQYVRDKQLATDL